MTYEILARAQTVPLDKVSCSQGVLSVKGATETWVTWAGDTNYNINAGDAAHGFSFAGPDPHKAVLATITATSPRSYSALLQSHLQDYAKGMGAFQLNLGQKPDLSHSTDELVKSYTTDVGNPALELVLFNYGRYLLFGSGRGALP